MQNLQQLLDKKNEDHDRLVVLFNAFQQGSVDQATNLLARLRIGESIESLAAEIEQSQASSRRCVRILPVWLPQQEDVDLWFPCEDDIDAAQRSGRDDGFAGLELYA